MLKSLFWSFLEQGGSRIVQLLVQVVLARLIDPEAFGILAILLVLTNVADSIAQSGLGMSLVQKSEVSSKDFTTAFWLSLMLAICMVVLLWIAAPVVAVFYDQQDLILLLRSLSVVVVFNSVNSVQRACLQRSMDFKKLFQTNLSASLASGVIGVTAAVMGAGVWALVIQTIAQSICTFLVMLKVVPWKPSFQFDVVSAKEMYSYGWKICVTGILNVVYTGVSELIVGRACSVADLGYYSQGRKWPAAAISLASNAMQNVFFPAFASVKDDRAALKGSMKKCLVNGSFLLVPAAFFFAIAADPIISLLLTDKWLPCAPVFQAICVLNSFMLLQIVNLRAYMAIGNSGLYMLLQIVKVTLSVVLIGGTAIVTRDIYAVSLANAVVGICCVLFVDLQPAKQIHGYSRFEQIKDIYMIYVVAIIAAVCADLSSLASMPAELELLVSAVVYMLVYLILARVLAFPGLEQCLQLIKRFGFHKQH